MAATYTSVASTWVGWVESTASTTCTGDVYANWVDEGTTTAITTISSNEPYQMQSQAGREEIEALRERNRISAEANEKRRSEVVERARKLLVDSLTPDQKKDYDKDMSFIVYGQKTGNRYRINHGRAGNVHRIDGGKLRKYCAHPAMHVPNEDTMLAQKLMIEIHEEDFLRLANAS